MKGIVFNIFSDLVVEKFGMQMLNDIIADVKPESGGIYTSINTYDDQEMFHLVGALSVRTKIAINDLIHVYGEYMFPLLAKKHHDFVAGHNDVFSLLKTLNDVIHVQVLKLYPDAVVPDIQCEHSVEQIPDQMILSYTSPRKLCALAEGLITGAATYFNQPLAITHSVCMHEGAPQCQLILKKQ